MNKYGGYKFMKYKITLSGKTYEVEVENGEAILLDEYEAVAPAPVAAPMAAAAPAAASAPAAAPAPVPAGSGETITSPMPGNILKINVSAGQAVKAGDVLVVLEAMKMENEIVAPHDGTVSQVITSVGAVVDTGAPLLVLA